MKGRLSAIVFTTAIALACSGGSAGDPTGTQTPNPTPGTPPPVPPPADPPPSDDQVSPPFGSVANFNIVDDSFVDENGNHDAEATVTVKVGQIVSWTQNGKKVHRVEFSSVPKDGRSDDSGDLRPLTTHEFRPNMPGEYIFFCRYHEYMMDVKIIVEAP